MDLFDRLFKKERTSAKTDQVICAPMDGKVISMKDIPDEVFSQGVLGSGCGIEPSGDTVVAPFDGTITTLADTKHAVGVTGDNGLVLLIHVGMDTAAMKGKGFESFVKEGNKVSKGEKLITFSPEAIKKAGHPLTTAVVLRTDTEDLGGKLEVTRLGDVKAGDVIMKIR